MPEASSGEASVTQQSRQRVPQSQTKYRECPKATSTAVKTHSVFTTCSPPFKDFVVAIYEMKLLKSAVA